MKNKSIKKGKDFLSQIPDWEHEYKCSDEAEITFQKNDWLFAKAEFTDKELKIFGHAVMEDWETPYMQELAKISTSKGGVVLELGFGMAISATFIEEEKIKKHIIIEANHDVAERARKFAEKSKHETKILEGFWEEKIDEIPDESIDGILFDTYPLTDSELYQNHFNFFPFAFKKLKKGGVFTYYSDEIKALGKVHMRKLQEAGFNKENISYRVIPIQPPVDCKYWKANTILAPIIIK